MVFVCSFCFKFMVLWLCKLLVIVNIPSDLAEGETPVPIPNTVVKPFKADGTALATVWESR